MKRLLRAILVFSLLGIALVPTGGAQVTQSELDELRERLRNARDHIRNIQSKANTVEEAIASIDEEAAAVEAAIEAADQLILATQADIAVLEDRIDQKQAVYDERSEQARNIARELYKGGVTGQLELVLGSERIDELLSRLEYSAASSRNNLNVMVQTKRLKLQLQSFKAQLEVKLEEAISARAEKEAHARHLAELRAAKRQKLADLRADIQAERKEAEGLQDRSDELERQLRIQAAREAAAEARADEAATVSIPSAPNIVNLGPSASGFAWPLNGAVTSGYGWRWGRMHNGIDIDGNTGDPIRASKEGTVFFAGYDDNGYGNHVVLTHEGGYSTVYAHATTVNVSVGQHVSQGQLLATVGCTGSCTGPHLHFEIRVNGSPQDPMRYLP